MTSTMTQQLDADFKYIDWMLDGMESLICNTGVDFKSLSGNESWYCLHFDADQLAGNEANKYIDSIKTVAGNLYKNLTDMLKRVREYFFGEGEKAAVESAENATEAVNAMADLNGAAPIPDDAPSRDPGTYLTSLEGGTEVNELLDEMPELKAALEKIKASAQKVKDSKTVASMRATYAEMVKAANAGIQTVSGSLRKALSEAEKAAGELRNPKLPKEGDTPEVQSAIKQENQEGIAEAKSETKKTRLIGGIRNKIVSALNTVTAQSKATKDKLPDSKFKG